MSIFLINFEHYQLAYYLFKLQPLFAFPYSAKIIPVIHIQGSHNTKVMQVNNHAKQRFLDLSLTGTLSCVEICISTLCRLAPKITSQVHYKRGKGVCANR